MDNSVTVLGRFARVFAPASVLSALLYYFGYIYTAAQAKYWNIAPTYLRLSTTDYVLRSSTAAYVSLVRGVVAVLAGAVIWRSLRPWIERTARRRLCFILASFAGGTLGVVVGLMHITEAREGQSIWVAILLMASGVLLIGGFALVDSPERPLLMALSTAIVVVGAFAWVHIYARTAGVERAREITMETQGLADLLVYSREPLPLFAVHDVRMTVLNENGPGPVVFRYQCLKLLTRFNDTLFVVPDDYALNGNARVVYAIDANAVRLDFDGRQMATGRTAEC